MEKQSPLKYRKLFNQKLQSKQATISREELLRLLNEKKLLIQDKKKIHGKVNSIVQKQIQSQSVNQKLKKIDSNIIKKIVINRSTNKMLAANRYIKIEEQVKQQKVQLTKNYTKLKLPSLSKLPSHNTNLLRKNTQNISQLGKKGASTGVFLNKIQKSESVHSNHFTDRVQLDSYALHHLQSLETFQRQLRQKQSKKAKLQIL